jgi:hypothetical protein
MKSTSEPTQCARASRKKSRSSPDPVTELRCGRAAFADAAIHFEIAALSTNSPLHAKHLARLSQLTQEAARPIGRLLRRMEREGVFSA